MLNVEAMIVLVVVLILYWYLKQWSTCIVSCLCAYILKDTHNRTLNPEKAQNPQNSPAFTPARATASSIKVNGAFQIFSFLPFGLEADLHIQDTDPLQ